jgi:spermidine synthase
MTGIAVGSIVMTQNIDRIRNSLSLFMRLELGIILFSCLSVLTIIGLAGYPDFLSLVFMVLFFASGLFLGLEFPLASKMYLTEKENVGQVAGLLYFSDLIGGCIGGILGAVIFLPILGLFNTCLVIIFVKLSSLILLGIFAKRLTKRII